jgi:hypothetical protein
MTPPSYLPYICVIFDPFNTISLENALQKLTLKLIQNSARDLHMDIFFYFFLGVHMHI